MSLSIPVIRIPLQRRWNNMDIKLDYSNVKFQDNGKLKLLIIVGTRP